MSSKAKPPIVREEFRWIKTPLVVPGLDFRVSRSDEGFTFLTMNLPKNLPGYAALGVLALLAVALFRRRFRIGYLLLLFVVALGERWRDERVRTRLAGLVDALPDEFPEPGSTSGRA